MVATVSIAEASDRKQARVDSIRQKHSSLISEIQEAFDAGNTTKVKELLEEFERSLQGENSIVIPRNAATWESPGWNSVEGDCRAFGSQ